MQQIVRRAIACLPLVLTAPHVAALPAPGDTDARTAAGEPAPAARSPSPSMEPMALPEVVVLSNGDVDRYLAVAEQCIEEKIDVKRDGFMGNEAALAVLAAHNVTPERMNAIAYSISLAVRKLDTPEEQIEAQYRQAKQILSKMTLDGKDQRSAFAAQMRLAAAMIEQLRSQPQDNVALVAERRDEISALAERADALATARQTDMLIQGPDGVSQ